jgi:hypothetical protein
MCVRSLLGRSQQWSSTYILSSCSDCLDRLLQWYLTIISQTLFYSCYYVCLLGNTCRDLLKEKNAYFLVICNSFLIYGVLNLGTRTCSYICCDLLKVCNICLLETNSNLVIVFHAWFLSRCIVPEWLSQNNGDSRLNSGYGNYTLTFIV